MTDHSGRDVVGNIRNDQIIAGIDQVLESQLQNIPLNHLDVLIWRKNRLKWGKQLLVQFDRDDLFSRGRQITRQASQARADLQYDIGWFNLRSSDDFFEGEGILEEVLPKAFISAQAVTFQDCRGIQGWDLIY